MGLVKPNSHCSVWGSVNEHHFFSILGVALSLHLYNMWQETLNSGFNVMPHVRLPGWLKLRLECGVFYGFKRFDPAHWAMFEMSANIAQGLYGCFRCHECAI